MKLLCLKLILCIYAFLVVDDETEKEISIEEMPVVEASKIPIQVKGIMLS